MSLLRPKVLIDEVEYKNYLYWKHHTDESVKELFAYLIDHAPRTLEKFNNGARAKRLQKDYTL